MIILENRRARFGYEIIKKYTAGLKLLGEEAKALREGKGNFKGSYIKALKGDLYLVNFNLPKYSKSSNPNYNPKRPRKLLLNKREIREIISELNNKGRTAIPLSIYLKNNLFKLDLATAKGLGKTQKKQKIKEKQMERDAKRELKELRNYL